MAGTLDQRSIYDWIGSGSSLGKGSDLCEEALVSMMAGKKFKEALEPMLFQWFLPGRNNWLWCQLKLCAADRTAQKLQE